MKAKITDLGRHKWSGEVQFNTMNGLLRAIAKHLMSRSIDIEAEDGSNVGSVIVGGFRAVGKVELLDGVFRVAVTQDVTVIATPKKSSSSP